MLPIDVISVIFTFTNSNTILKIHNISRLFCNMNIEYILYKLAQDCLTVNVISLDKKKLDMNYNKEYLHL